jgi:hypothetical protein
MNINAFSYEVPVGSRAQQETLATTIDRHAAVMMQAGFPVQSYASSHALLEAVGREFQGAFRVWLRLDDGSYVWIDTEGEAHFREAWS